MTRYYALNFIRKPEFMGFNGYNDGIKRTEFNPNAWGISAIEDLDHTGQNSTRAAQWADVRDDEQATAKALPRQYASAYFELIGYPVEASAMMNFKFLSADLIYLDAHNHVATRAFDPVRARAAYDAIQTLTAKYNSLEDGKWDGIMSDAPRERHVFEMPKLATAAEADAPLPGSWGTGDAACQAAPKAAAKPESAVGFVEKQCTVSISVAHFARKVDTSAYSAKVGRVDPAAARWNILADLGISGDSIVYGRPGLLADLDVPALASGQDLNPTAWLEYDFTTTSNGPATLTLHLLPTFPLDSDHKLRYAVALDGGAAMERDMSGSGGAKAAGAGDGPSGADWPQNVLRNSAIDTIQLGQLAPGKHTLRLLYRDPGVVFEHLVITFPGAPPAYPVPPETK
jgi:hypothetical protein